MHMYVYIYIYIYIYYRDICLDIYIHRSNTPLAPTYKGDATLRLPKPQEQKHSFTDSPSSQRILLEVLRLRIVFPEIVTGWYRN